MSQQENQPASQQHTQNTPGKTDAKHSFAELYLVYQFNSNFMSWEHYLVHSSSLLVHFLPIIVHYGSSQDSASAIRLQLGVNQSRAKHSFIQHLLNQASQLRKPYLQKWQPGKRQILATQGGQDKHRDSLDVCATN